MNVLILVISNMVWQEIPSRFGIFGAIISRCKWVVLVSTMPSSPLSRASCILQFMLIIFTQYDGNSRNPDCSCKLTDHTGI
ncbi:hypothetical protein MKW92_048873 [Papaver armeniacum]|nr:hypothetical protein MKW92_048873 [Papaver armeniacum]